MDKPPRACAVCAYPASSRCAGCGKAFYCSKEHQKTAWEKHKRLCKMYKAAKNGKPMPPPDAFCGLCGEMDGPLMQTECCGRTLCDDYHKYQLLSYSNDSCARNHERYTRCCSHHNECLAGIDVLECEHCDHIYDPESVVWFMTNRFNFQQDIERAIPRPFLPTLCASCGTPIKLNAETVVHTSRGKACQRCSGGLAAGIPGKHIYMMDGLYR